MIYFKIVLYLVYNSTGITKEKNYDIRTNR